MRGSRGMCQAPFTRTYVGRFVVEKKPSGRTPSAGTGTNVASGKPANGVVAKSGCGKEVTLERSLGGEGHTSHGIDVVLSNAMSS